jgi:putative heme iron utilization protein
MSSATSSSSGNSTSDAASSARQLLRCARKGALATIDQETGHPYASLVTVATEPDGTPVFLLSQLALHTRNVVADARASVLIDGSDAAGNPLAGGRVTLIGRVGPAISETAARRFLARHPSAQGYAGFADFSYFALRVERAHFIGGFGRISTLAAPDVLIEVGGAESLIAAEPELLDVLNREAGSRLERLGENRSRGRQGKWRAIALDPAGVDIALRDETIIRVDFPSQVNSPGEVLRAIAELD